MTSSFSSSSSPVGRSPGEAPGEVEILDLCGEVCPFTFVRTKLAMEQLPIGGRLRVIVDHEPAMRNIPRSAREWGQQVLEIEPAGEHRWTIDLVRVR